MTRMIVLVVSSKFQQAFIDKVLEHQASSKMMIRILFLMKSQIHRLI